MSIKIGKKDIIWGYLGQIMYSGINILILPFVLKLLSQKEVGLWYTFTAIGGLVSLLDFGIKTTITRNITYAWSGMDNIPKSGSIVCSESQEPNIQLFAKVKDVSRIIYTIIGSSALFLLITIGTYYIVVISKNNLLFQDYFAAWVCYCLAIFVNICYGYWSPVLKGIGAIKENYQAEVLSKLVQMVVSIFGLLLGGKLLAVSIAFLISAIFMRVISYILFNKYEDVVKVKESFRNAKIKKGETKEIFKLMWPNAYKQGIMSLSNYLTDKIATLVCSAVFGLSVSAMWGLTLQLFSVISTIANVFFNSYMPFMIQLRVKNKNEKAYLLLINCLSIQLAFYILGGASVMLLAKPLLSIIGSSSSILPISQSFVLLIFIWIFNFQQICTAFIIANNQMPMYRAYLFSGLITVALELLTSYTLGGFIGYWTLIISQVVVLISYNGWKWASYIAKEQGTTFFNLFSEMIKGLMIIPIFKLRSSWLDQKL